MSAIHVGHSRINLPPSFLRIGRDSGLYAQIHVPNVRDNSGDIAPDYAFDSDPVEESGSLRRYLNLRVEEISRDHQVHHNKAHVADAGHFVLFMRSAVLPRPLR